jgi:hypothetical protein
MRRLCDANEEPMLVDLAIGCDVTLPHVVVVEAEAAAGMLLRLTPYPFGYPHCKGFHTRFRRRYCPGAVIAVRDLAADPTWLTITESWLAHCAGLRVLGS